MRVISRAASLLPSLLAVARPGLTPASNDELPTTSRPLPHGDLLSTGRMKDRVNLRGGLGWPNWRTGSRQQCETHRAPQQGEHDSLAAGEHAVEDVADRKGQ